MKRLLKYIISIILILLPGYMLYRGLVDFVTPPAPQRPTTNNQQPTTENKPTPTLKPVAETTTQLLPIKIKTATKEITIYVEIADNDTERSYGLMNRTTLAKDRGMIFVYNKEEAMAFWMKNTLIPLDVIFLNRNKEVVSAETMQPCKADPCPSYYSKFPAQYAIEVNAGFVKENNIAYGNTAVFNLTNTK